MWSREVSGGPMSWTRLSHLTGWGLTPGRSTKTLSATQLRRKGREKKRKQEKKERERKKERMKKKKKKEGKKEREKKKERERERRGREFIISNWLTWLWMQTNPKICSYPRLENQDSQWCSSLLKVSRLETQKELMFQFKCEGRKNNVPGQRQPRRRDSPLLPEGPPFYVIQAFSWVVDACPHQRGQSVLLSLPI